MSTAITVPFDDVLTRYEPVIGLECTQRPEHPLDGEVETLRRTVGEEGGGEPGEAEEMRSPAGTGDQPEARDIPIAAARASLRTAPPVAAR